MTAKLAAAVFVAGFLAAIVAVSVSSALHVIEGRIFIVSKERLLRVETTDGRTSSTQEYWVTGRDDLYRVEDSLLHWHFYSGQVYASLAEGRECDVTLQGYRVGFLSMFQNTLAADCGRTE
jgi:hypothetical protein